MGCNQPGIDNYPIPCKDAERVALLTDFAVAMKAKLDACDEKYPRNIHYGITPLCRHMCAEHAEFIDAWLAFNEHVSHSPINISMSRLKDLEAECIDVANMAFLVREECIRIRKENEG